MNDVRLAVVSCPSRRPIQEIWKACQQANWPDCPYPVDILSPLPDVGWNANLILYLNGVKESLVLLLLDDHFVAPNKEHTGNMEEAAGLMMSASDIALIKLQDGNAHPPDLEFPAWPRLREYDRAHHPFKRTNLVPTMFRRDWLIRLSTQVKANCGKGKDVGRLGALEFEVEGTRLTKNAAVWPERMLGIHRPDADGGGGRPLLKCLASDGVREGRLYPGLAIPLDVASIPGIEAFL